MIIVIPYRRTRSSTAEIMTTAPLPQLRAFFILSITSLTTSELTTVATTFLVVYGRLLCYRTADIWIIYAEILIFGFK
jgi:hypothetical protein